MNQQRKRRAKGFTLVELMVALTGGLIFSIFVFMMTRDVSRFFSQEAGLSDATTALLTGYQRLRADVQRSGFLASPNFVKDRGRCPGRNPTTGVPGLGNINGPGWTMYDLLQKLALARVSSSTPTTWQTANGLAPDELVMYGNYTSEDQYPVRSYGAGIIFLNPASEELARAGYTTATADATLDRLFPTNSVVRVVSANTGEEQYSVVLNQTTSSGPQISLVANMPLVMKSDASGSNCGVRGTGADLLVNPVNIVRYRLGSLAGDAAYAALYSGTGGTAGAEAAWPRFDLLREELDPRSTVTTPISQELVAEFAVDFRVGAQVVTNTTTYATTALAEGNALIPEYLGDSTSATVRAVDRGPQLVRALRPRLAIRTRAPDRQANVASGSGLYRVPLSTGADFARVRTLQSLIMTRNARSKIWN